MNQEINEALFRAPITDGSCRRRAVFPKASVCVTTQQQPAPRGDVSAEIRVLELSEMEKTISQPLVPGGWGSQEPSHTQF